MITLDKGEKIKYIARRHNLAYLIEIFLLFLAAVAPYVLYLYQKLYWLDSLFAVSGSNPFFLHVSLYNLWLLFLWILFFIAWNDYYLDVWIITDGRIIDVEQIGLFRRQVNNFRLDKIMSMNVSRNNLGRLLNYGDLEILLEDGEKFLVAEVPDPEKVKQKIIDEQRQLFVRMEKIMTGALSEKAGPH